MGLAREVIMKTMISGATVFDGDHWLTNHAIIINGECIEAVLPTLIAKEQYPAMPEIKLNGGVVAPGFIDLQVNGGGGVLFNNAPTTDTIKTMLKAHRRGGTTSMLPTLISDTVDVLQTGVAAVQDVIQAGHNGVLGVHIEGPFFNINKRGVHKETCIRPLSQQDIDWISSIDAIKVMLTLAPEQTQAGQIRALTNAGVVVCAGHTNATFQEIEQAIAEGLSGFTHLYNAMSQQQGREPGTVGAALADPNSYCSIIVDGHHVHPASIQTAVASKPRGKVYLITDAMASVGSKVKSFSLYGETIQEQQGRLVNSEGRLAGSAITMMDAVRTNTTLVKIDLSESLRMASLYPAQFMQIDHQYGRLQSNYRADLVHFGNDYQVLNTWVAGQQQSHSPATALDAFKPPVFSHRPLTTQTTTLRRFKQ
jgi:N-acetylglucosamine-6-phosphate deacetylase